MSLEPITRQEKIIAGQDLTPITRLEKFLKNFGGSGGGGGAQPDLSQTDPTQPDYVKGVIRQESLPDGYPYKEMALNELASATMSGFAFDSEAQLYVSMDATFGLLSNLMASSLAQEMMKSGTPFTVVWDGVAYECAFNLHTGTIGNLGFRGQADTGEPFLICGESVGYACATRDEGESHSVSFQAVTETIHTMATEFLPELTLTSPNGTKYKLTVSDDGTLSAVAQS